MKRRPSRRPPPRRRRNGRAATAKAVLQFVNPRPPSVPTTLDLRLDEYFAGAALIGVLASQAEEPDPAWVRTFAWRIGRDMASDAIRRRRKKTG